MPDRSIKTSTGRDFVQINCTFGNNFFLEKW